MEYQNLSVSSVWLSYAAHTSSHQCLSISTCSFPKKWKTANIEAIPKKTTDEYFQMISDLSLSFLFVSKFLKDSSNNLWRNKLLRIMAEISLDSVQRYQLCTLIFRATNSSPPYWLWLSECEGPADNIYWYVQGVWQTWSQITPNVACQSSLQHGPNAI